MNQNQTDFLVITGALATFNFTTDAVIKTILALKTELRTVQNFSADLANLIVDALTINVTPDFISDTPFFTQAIADYAQTFRNLYDAIATMNTDNDKDDLFISRVKRISITYTF